MKFLIIIKTALLAHYEVMKCELTPKLIIKKNKNSRNEQI